MSHFGTPEKQLLRDQRRRAEHDARKAERRGRSTAVWDDVAASEPLCCTSCEEVFDVEDEMILCPYCDVELVGVSFAHVVHQGDPGWWKYLDGYTVAMVGVGLLVSAPLWWPWLSSVTGW